MSNIKPNSQFRPNLTVGNTIGERRSKGIQYGVPRIQAQPQPPVDEFSKAQKNAKNLDAFTSNATFRKARKFGVADVPHKTPLHHHLEQGTAPRLAREMSAHGTDSQISDDKSLSFLDKVIKDERLWNSSSLKRAYAQASRPAYPNGQPKQAVKKAD